MDWGKYNIIRTMKDLANVDEYLMTDDEPNFDLISFDTETNGLHFWNNVVIGFSFSVNSKQGFYIPLLDWIPDETTLKKRKVKKVAYNSYMEGQFQDVWRPREFHPEDVNPKQYQPPQLIKFCLDRWLNHPKVSLIMHNAPFDVLFVDSNFGVDLAPRLFVDTLLLKHVIDENSSLALKETALLWQDQLDMDIEGQANKEKLELVKSIIENGGSKAGQVWRGAPPMVGKYAAADAFLTYAIFEVASKIFREEYTPEHVEWFFNGEVMPLCRELVIPMKKRGVRINVPYFEKLERETKAKMEELEDLIIQTLGDDLCSFSIGDSIDDAVSKKSLILKIMEMERLEHPTKIVKGEVKKSLDKSTIKKSYQENPHWLWGYILGEDELKYSDEQVAAIRQSLYEAKINRRYRFNIGSDAHLRWLFFTQYRLPDKDHPKTDSGLASMKAEFLKQYFVGDFPWVKTLMLYKKHRKLYSTYILPALKLRNGEILHMNMNQAGTISGRFSCSGGFNLQTLPAVEELDRCPSCGCTSLEITYPIELLADVKCTNEECDYEQENILCPSAIKKGFIAPDDYVIMNADYSSLEPRCFAFCSGDQGLKDVYQKGLDLYSKVYIDTEEPDGPYSANPKDKNFLKKAAPEKRSMVKPVCLGIPYGANDWQVAKLMGFKKTYIDRKTGKELETPDTERGRAWIDKYLGAHPNLRKYMEKQETESITQGFVETIVGRRRHFKFTMPVYALISSDGMSIDDLMAMKRKDLDTTDVKDSKWLTMENLTHLSKMCGFNLKDKKEKWRTWDFVRAMFKNEINNSKNFSIQGLAAHITNRAMIEMQREFNAKNLRSFVVLQVHDEITCYTHKNDVEESLAIMQECMEKNKYALLIDVPMIAAPIVATTLKEAK